MTDLVDLASEARGTVFEVLKQSVDPTLCAVFDNVPENTQPNYLVLGTVDVTNQGRPGEQFELIKVEVAGVYRGGDRGVLLKMMHAARVALDCKRFQTDVAAFPQCRFATGSSGIPHEDGVTFAGLYTFELLAQPA